MRPIEQAAEIWAKVEPRISFQDQLVKQLFSENGAVVSTPKCFAMAGAFDFDGKSAWFIDIAVGDIYEIIRSMPAPLPYTAFCRGIRNDTTLRIYPSERFLRKLLHL